MILKRFFYLLTLSLISFDAFGMNLLRPYDSLIRPMYTHNYPWQASVWAEFGISDKGYNSDNHTTNVLRIWNDDQNALAMLDGFDDESTIGQKRIQIDASDDGVRGHFCVDADLKNRFSGMLAMRSFFKDTWSVSAYLPLYSMELEHVCFVDQTKDTTAQDLRVKDLLTDDFFANVCELGDGYDLSGWQRTGVGDLTLMLEWFYNFVQAKPMLKNVRVNWRLGVGLPTGLRQDEDKLFALPFGYDGAFSLPFGVGLDLHSAFYVRAGFDVQLTHVFGNTRTRRIKTSQNQTDLLLLQKQEVYKDFGLTQQFNLYAQLYRIFKGFSFMLGYQFLKHGADQIALCPGANFSGAVANSAEHLKEWTLHQLVVRADYEAGVHMDDPSFYPRISLFAQIPFNGKRVAATRNLGLTFSLDF